MPGSDHGAVVASLVRNGSVESVHLGHVAVCGSDGAVLARLGDPDRLTYVRSAVKPLQALAVLDILHEAGAELDDDGLAIACASHDGSDEQQIEAARLLAEAGLDEAALQCPPAVPRDPDTAWSQRWPYALSHNCSGKHAAFLLATVAAGDDPVGYLSVDSALQRRVRGRVEEVCGTQARGPGVDGCGAPAWMVPLRGLATAFARLAAGSSGDLQRVRDAMASRPLLIGGPQAADSQLMQSGAAAVAKRGAEAVFAAAVETEQGTVGVAVKITDGGVRAAGPVAASVLHGLGRTVPGDLLRPPVAGGGQVQGALLVHDDVGRLAGSVTGR